MRALEQLNYLGALDDEGDMTDLGRQMAELVSYLIYRIECMNSANLTLFVGYSHWIPNYLKC